MNKSSLLKRGAEVLAGLIIVVTAVIYTTAGIRNAGSSIALMMDFKAENSDETKEVEDLASAKAADSTSSEEVALNEYGSLSSCEENKQLDEEQVDLQTDAEVQSEENNETAKEQQLTGTGTEENGSENESADTAPPVYKYVNVNYLNVRQGPGSDTEKVTILEKATRVKCFNSDGEWVKISTDDNVEGYVFAEYLSDTAPPVYKFVIANAINLRKGPSSDTELLGTVAFGSKLQVFEKSDDYVRVLTNDGKEGYVYNEYLADEITLASRSSSGSVQSHNSDLASKIVDYAKQFVGVPYVYGGTSPNGFDCSGFTYYVFKKFGITLPRTAQECAGVGTKVSRENIKPGDILLFDRDNDYRIGHVGIYIGNGKFIHASSSKGKVVIASLSSYGGHLLGIRRVIK